MRSQFCAPNGATVTLQPAISIPGPVAFAPTTAKTATYAAKVGDLVQVDATTADVPITCPANPLSGQAFAVIRLDASTHSVTVAPASGLISGRTAVPLTRQWAGGVFLYSGTAWVISAAMPGLLADELVGEAYTYDGLGNMIASTTGGVTTTYTYDSGGNVATESRAGRTKTYTYDGSGNVTGSVVS